MIKAVKFLTSAVSKAQHAGIFRDPATLRAIAEKVVVPNLLLREAGACAPEPRDGREASAAVSVDSRWLVFPRLSYHQDRKSVV